MNGWLAFQLAVDIALFLLLIFFILRGGSGGGADVDELKALLEEFNVAVEKSQKTARELDAQLDARREALSALELVRPRGGVPGSAATLAPPGPGPALDPRAIAEKKRNVRMLYLQGVSTEEIGRRLSIPKPEVDLIIAMMEV